MKDFSFKRLTKSYYYRRVSAFLTELIPQKSKTKRSQVILSSYDILCFDAGDGGGPEKTLTYVPGEGEVVVNISGGSISALKMPVCLDGPALQPASRLLHGLSSGD